MYYTTTCIASGFYHLRGKSLWHDININTSSYIYCRGYTNEQASAFRQCFSKLGELRSLVPNNTPILALTATASSQTIASVTKSLSLPPNMKKIYISPNRPNIYLFNKNVFMQ